MRIFVFLLWCIGLIGLSFHTLFAQNTAHPVNSYMVRFSDARALEEGASRLAKHLNNGESVKQAVSLKKTLKPHPVSLWLRVNTDRPQMLALARALPGFQILEQRLEADTLFVPNDPEAGAGGPQSLLFDKVKAYSAWDSTRGDSSIVIGILDTGTDYLHLDLDNVSKRYQDPLNGLDDDQNGLIDDFWGYDLADNDPYPLPLATNAHGTNVASISSASTDNGLGIAGIGFQCKYRPYKIYGADFAGYEAIIQAAEDGCRVINCSWGRNGNPSQWEQDVLDYAIRVKGAVVVAAAGNTAGQFDFFPASYPGVISVGFTNLDDRKHPNSTVSPQIDLVAPAGSVYGILSTGLYGNLGGGSSFAAPMVSAGAALLLSKWPDLSPGQVEARLKAFADVVDSIPMNKPFRGLMGAGRLNLEKALSSQNKDAGAVSGPLWADPEKALLSPGDTVRFSICFSSLLRAMPGVHILIASLDTASFILLNSQISNSDSIGSAGFCWPAFPFQGVVKPRVAFNKQVILEVTAQSSGIGYSQKFYLIFRVNSAYATVGTFGERGFPSGVAFSVGANSRLGFIDDAYLLGDGFRINGKNYLGEAGLILASDSIRVLSTLTGQAARDRDFFIKGSGRTGFEGFPRKHWAVWNYTDSIASAPVRIGVKVQHTAYVMDIDSLRYAGFNEYVVQNASARRLDSLRAGVLLDWGIGNPQRNRTRYNPTIGVGYTWSSETGVALGSMLLSPMHRHAFTGIDLINQGGENLNLLDGFSRQEKYRAITGKRTKQTAGMEDPDGGNVVTAHGGTLTALDPGTKARFAVILLFGQDSNALFQNAQAAERWFREEHSGPSWPASTSLTFCKGDSARLTTSIQGSWKFYSENNILIGQGRSLALPYRAGIDSMDVYAANADSVFEGNAVKVKVRWAMPTAAFSVPNTIVIESLPFVVVGNPVNSSETEYTVRLGSQLRYRGDGPNLVLTDTILSTPGNYRICQKATLLPSCIDSICYNVLVNTITNTKIESVSKLIITPNPAKGHLRITGLGNRILGNLEIQDLAGRRYPPQIIKNESGEIVLSVADLPSGFYLVRLGNSRSSFIKAAD